MKEKQSKNNSVWKCLECWSVTVSDYFGQGYSPDTVQLTSKNPSSKLHAVCAPRSGKPVATSCHFRYSIYHRCQYWSNIITIYWCLQKIEIFWYNKRDGGHKCMTRNYGTVYTNHARLHITWDPQICMDEQQEHALWGSPSSREFTDAGFLLHTTKLT